MFARALPYARRLELTAAGARGRASLAGIALALRALADLGVAAEAGALHFPQWGKPALRRPPTPGADFSVSHAGHWVACAAVRGGRVGLDIECGGDPGVRAWVLREAALKCLGHALATAPQVRLEGERVCVGTTWLHAQRITLAAGIEAALAADGPVQLAAPRCLRLAELLDPRACAA